MPSVSLADIEAAHERVRDTHVVEETPIEYSRSFSERADADVYLKMEHLQRTGSFKTRGAYNKISQLAGGTADSRASVDAASGGVGDGFVPGVVAASAGNHAQGVALAASTVGLESTIVMPETAPQAKVDATRGYGADVELVGGTFQAALEHARELERERGLTFVHAYDDPAIVAGQGTLGLELHEQFPDVDTVLVPIGGGGLISGVATALKERAVERDSDVRVIGVQAADAATVPDSLKKGEPVGHPDPQTIADGIATGGISELTLEHIDAYVNDVVTVTDDEIAHAILLLLERAKQLVEGAGAAATAALLGDAVDVTGETVVSLLCGGNIDVSALQEVLSHAQAARHQLLHLRVRIQDRPGMMADVSRVLADEGANIRSVRHERAVDDLDVGEAYLMFRVQAAGREHADALISRIRDAGYDVTRLAHPE
jgi:threonine dehydratase